MTATIDYAPPTSTTSVPVPPTVQCPGCKEVVQHATKCRLCNGDMPDFPFCFKCRTWTAPIDKTTCVEVEKGTSTQAARYALRGCPLCRSMPPDDFLKNVGMLMNLWATEVSKLRPSAPRPAPLEAVVQPSAELPIRVLTTQVGLRISTVVEYDLRMVVAGASTTAVNHVAGDLPLGMFLKDIAERYAAMQAQLAEVVRERDEFTKKWDGACHEITDLKSLLEEKTAPTKKSK